MSQGLLQNTELGFPANRYGLVVRTTATTPRIRAVTYGASSVAMFSSGAIANYPHNGGATTDEVELYLRRQSDNKRLGYIANVFKFKVDGSATTPAIGDIVNLDFSNTAGFYSSYGSNRKGIVAGRLGDTSGETSLNGDYLVMLVAGGN